MTTYAPHYLWVSSSIQVPQQVSKNRLTRHLVDHGHLRSLPSILLFCQDIHSPLLPSSVPAASEAALRHLRSHGLLYHLLLGRLLHRHRPLQRPEPTMGYHGDNELFRLRQAHFRDRRPGSCCRCHHTRVSHPDGGEATHLVGTEDILAIRLLSWFDVSPRHVHGRTPGIDTNTYA